MSKLYREKIDQLQAAEQERFEQAAQLRDRMRAIQRAGQHQMVVASGFSDMDILAFVQGFSSRKANNVVDGS